MARLILRSEFEEEYASKFDEEMGASAKSFRMALGALIIKEKLGVSDRAHTRANQGKPLSKLLYRNIVL